MICQICKEDVDKVYKHHVIPKSKGGKETIDCCSTCAGQVHMLFNEKELAMMTLEDLIFTPQMQKYIKWRKKHSGDHTFRMSSEVKKFKKYHR